MASSPSFNDFSLHVGQDMDHPIEHSVERPLHRPAVDARSTFASSAGQNPGGAVTNFPLLLSRASPLRIPRSTAAYGLGKSEAGIPPSPGGASLSTPRESMETSVPGTPSSPRTPGGRRRSPKIDGLDYYEFCELIRSSSM
ncbi:hypothetical protein APUTEX25_004309 [Auxenochlorella protothecoides]|nr:hypothetical protein APUTEX25_004309 [Auxenochlorella protothecoides]|eukprot:RMZ57475.1 hypothetical protein APUTEX25_004309 [Auxenochlorella protothecoides]